MKKGLLIGGGVIVVLIIAGVVTLLSSLDSLIKTAVETAGSEVTGVSVTLDKAAVSISSGKGSLGGLNVGNPAGFKTDRAFNLGEISITIDTATVTSDPVVIKEIVIAGPKVTYEMGSSGSNIDAIQRNVEKFMKANGGGGSSASSSDGGEGPKLVIEHLYVRGGEINVSATFLGGKKLTTPLPNIHMTDIGKDKGGASPGEIASQLIDKMTAGAGSAVGSLDLEGMKGAVTDAVSGGTDAAKKVMEQGTSGASDALKDAGGALKGLLGN